MHSRRSAGSNGDESSDIARLHLSTINAERRKYLMEAMQQEADAVKGEEAIQDSGTDERAVDAVEEGSQDVPQAVPEDVPQGEEKAQEEKAKSNGRRFRKPVFKLKFFNQSPKPKDPNAKAVTTSIAIQVEEEISAETLKSVQVVNLPQNFVVKYLGRTPCNGYNGIKAVRKPIDSLVKAVGNLRPGTDLPLIRLCVSGTGISTNIHPMNNGTELDSLILPVQCISYAVQDTRFCRVLALIYIRDAGKSKEQPECHGFVCPTPLAARRLAISLSESFKCISTRLKGDLLICRGQQPVDVRTPDEIINEQDKNSFV